MTSLELKQQLYKILNAENREHGKVMVGNFVRTDLCLDLCCHFFYMSQFSLASELELAV